MRQPFTVLSYNIQAAIGVQKTSHYVTRLHHQVLHMPAKARVLKSIAEYISAFDVVCLQEVDLGGRRSGFSNQVEQIAALSGHPHTAWQENRTVRKISRHGNAILSKYEILDCQDLKLPGKVSGRGMLEVRLDTQPESVVINTHLSLGKVDQAAQFAFIADRVQPSDMTIICGDLNCTANSAPMRQFSEAAELHALTGAGDKTYPSWAPRQGLDHILINRSGVGRSAHVDDIRFSDHRPVHTLIS